MIKALAEYIKQLKELRNELEEIGIKSEYIDRAVDLIDEAETNLLYEKEMQDLRKKGNEYLANLDKTRAELDKMKGEEQ